LSVGNEFAGFVCFSAEDDDGRMRVECQSKCIYMKNKQGMKEERNSLIKQNVKC
jgi:hypothetical protein